MDPHITVVTLGVSSLERSLAFYRDGMGLETEGIIGREFEHGAVVFFELQPGLKLALWPSASIEHDTGLSVQGNNAGRITIGHNVFSTEQVDLVMEQARMAGARIVKPACKTFYGGYAGYFSDPDGHLWDVVYNPHILPAHRA